MSEISALRWWKVASSFKVSASSTLKLPAEGVGVSGREMVKGGREIGRRRKRKREGWEWWGGRVRGEKVIREL